LSEIIYFYDLEKPGTFGVANQILRGCRGSPLKPVKPGVYRENRTNGIPR